MIIDGVNVKEYWGNRVFKMLSISIDSATSFFKKKINSKTWHFLTQNKITFCANFPILFHKDSVTAWYRLRFFLSAILAGIYKNNARLTTEH
jgi:hypothetical protein